MEFVPDKCYTKPDPECSEKICQARAELCDFSNAEGFVATRLNVVYLSAGLIGTALLMLSCASSTRPEQLTLRCKSHPSAVHVDTCISGASSSEVTLDDHGLGKTSLCPGAGQKVEIEIYETDQHFKLVEPEVRVQRTGDGMATSIEAKLPG
jgi:hypothetical protein